MGRRRLGQQVGQLGSALVTRFTRSAENDGTLSMRVALGRLFS
jgi:hypothetical protein